MSILILIFPPAPAKLLQSGPTLCDPIDGSPPGSPVPGILQATLLSHYILLSSSAKDWETVSNQILCN